MSDRELNDAYGLITDLRAKIAVLEAEAAGRALMDAEGDAFLPEVVTQLQAELQEAAVAMRQLVNTPAVVHVLGNKHTPTCGCGLCHCRAFLSNHT